MGINGHQSSLQSGKKLSKMLTIYFIASVVIGVYFLYEIYHMPYTSLFDIIFKITLSLLMPTLTGVMLYKSNKEYKKSLQRFNELYSNQGLSNTTTNNKDKNPNHDN